MKTLGYKIYLTEKHEKISDEQFGKSASLCTIQKERYVFGRKSSDKINICGDQIFTSGRSKIIPISGAGIKESDSCFLKG